MFPPVLAPRYEDVGISGYKALLILSVCMYHTWARPYAMPPGPKKEN